MRLQLNPFAVSAFLAVTLLAAANARAQSARVETAHTLHIESPTRTNMTVYTPGTDVTVSPADSITIKGGYEADVVSGASVSVKAGRSYASANAGADVVSTASVRDVRHSPRAALTLRKDDVTYSAHYTYGTENDYKSHAFSASARTDVYDHNTQFELSYARNFDLVCDRTQAVNDRPPRFRALEDSSGCFAGRDPLRTRHTLSVDALEAAWTQAWTSTFATQLAVGAQILSGFQSNPYRSVILAQGLKSQEHHPDNRARQWLAARANLYVRPLKLAIRIGGRVYRDTWDITSGTGDVEAERYLSEGLRVAGRVRYYRQTGASFWSDDYTGGDPPLGPKGQYWTGDRELSPFWSVAVGAPYVWSPALEREDSRAHHRRQARRGRRRRAIRVRRVHPWRYAHHERACVPSWRKPRRRVLNMCTDCAARAAGARSAWRAKACVSRRGSKAPRNAGHVACIASGNPMSDATPLDRRRMALDFDDHPLVAIWETTQACDLVCAHCRACATPRLDPRELTTAQGMKLLSGFAAMGTPLCVLTGGDPAKRADLVELVEHGVREGLTMALTPSGTPLMTEELLADLKRGGLARVAVSVDGPNASMHDAFRGVSGSFDESRRILEQARALGLETQINFTLSRPSLGELEAMASFTREVGASMLVAFVVIPTGRATAALTLSADEIERALEELARLGAEAPFQIKTTGAPQLRRILMQGRAKEVPTGLLRDVHEGVARGPRGITDGVGFLFVSHTGDVYPSGFLPLCAGNVKMESVGSLYRDSPLFRALRDADGLGGKCGACPFRRVCGGSRARAFAETGDARAEDPGCAYVPPGYLASAPGI